MKNDKSVPGEHIYKTIRERICLGDYPPGETLSEKVLADEFGVSRTPIRKVLQRLEYEKLVTVKRGIGTIVTHVNLRSLKEIYGLRMKLAEMIGTLLPVANPKEEHIESLEELMDQVRDVRAERDVRKLAKLNILMHEVRQPLIGNEELRGVFDTLYYRTSRVWLQVLPYLDFDEEVDFMMEEIEQTIKALLAGDMCAVGLVRRNGISLCLERMIDYLSVGTVEE
ncbi:MAG: GntR family transcriptional regulator [Anaerolineales bacterium]